MNVDELSIADLIIEAMPFSDEIIKWCHSHPGFKDGLKVTNPDNFYALGMVQTSFTENRPGDLVIGFISYDMTAKVFKQDFIVDLGERHNEFVLYTKLPRNFTGRRDPKYVKHINEFYSIYGRDGNYASTHHVDLKHIDELAKRINNPELSARARRAIDSSERIVLAGGRRHITQQELHKTLAKIRAEKTKSAS